MLIRLCGAQADLRMQQRRGTYIYRRVVNKTPRCHDHLKGYTVFKFTATYNSFLVYCRELAPGTVSLTGDWAQGDDSKHDSDYSGAILPKIKACTFIYIPSTCMFMWAAKALVIFRGCAGSSEPSLLAYAIGTIIS